MSLVENINRRKKLGISRSKKNSTISPKAYKAMKNNWKDSKRKIMSSGKPLNKILSNPSPNKKYMVYVKNKATGNIKRFPLETLI